MFAWCGVHVSPPRNSRRNCPPPVWIVLVAIRVSRYLVLICFCCSCVCWVILQGVCWPVFCNVVIHTCRGWQRYIPPLLRHFFLWVFILWLFHLVCIWGWCVWIHGVWVVLWYRSLIYLLSWIWPLWWRLRYWRGFWPPAYRLWVWLLHLGSLFGLLLLWILSCSFLFYLVAHFRWIGRMSRLSCDCLGFPLLWLMWLWWSSFYVSSYSMCHSSEFICRWCALTLFIFGFLISCL